MGCSAIFKAVTLVTAYRFVDITISWTVKPIRSISMAQVDHSQNRTSVGQTDASETAPLLGRKNDNSLASRFIQPVSRSHVDLILLVNYIITGLLDSSATAVWGVFVSMQTGNTIYVGLGIANPHSSKRWIKSAFSIACFCVGSFFFSRFHRALGTERQRTRGIIVGTYLAQLALIISAAVILHLTPKPSPGDEHDLHWHVLLPIACTAFQSAGQTSTSRALGYGSLTSTVLTSIYCDLFSDQKLFAGLSASTERNQRLLAPILLILGAIAGGLWSESDFGIEGALWTAAGLKSCIVVAWLFWRHEKTDNDI